MDRSHLAETNKTRPPLGMSRLAHGRPLLYALVVLVPLAAGLLIGRGDLLMVLGAIALVVSTGVAWRWPLVSTALALLAMGGYTIFQMTPDFVADALYVGQGVYFQDVVLVGMVALAIPRLASGRYRRRVAGLSAPIVGVSAWLRAAGVLVILSVSKSGWVPTVRRAAAIMVAVLAATLLAVITRINIWSALAERGQAALERRDTAGWRELVGESTLEQSSASPTAGRGLGPYWPTYPSSP